MHGEIDKALKESLHRMGKVDKRGGPNNLTFRIYKLEEYNRKINIGTKIINDKE